MKRGIIIGLLIVVSSVVLVMALDAPIITSPAEGAVLSARKVSLSATSAETADFYLVRNRLRSLRFRKICDDTTDCKFNYTAREGDNNISVRIINSSGLGEFSTSERNFLIDTKDPRIHRVRPRDGSLMNNNADNNFSVKYTEANLAKITLFYGNDSTFKTTTCDSGRSKTCDFLQDISIFDGQTINYWFDVEDVAGNIENSSVRTVTVDTTVPIVSNMSYVIDGRIVRFSFDITEVNFDKIIIKDHKDRRPRWRRLCSKLVVGTCLANKRFRSGMHDIDVKVLDKAGNEAMIYTNEMISV
jgi:hypothetical protein